jgi:iron complex transport system substrate-binding protein
MRLPLSVLTKFFVLLLMPALISACVTPTAPVPDSQPVEKATASPDGFPVMIENCGNTLTFAKAPETVLTHYHHSFELLAALGVGDKIKYRLNYSDGPILPEHQAVYDAAQEISGSIAAPPKEVTVSLKPELIVGYYNFNAERGNATVEELLANGTMVYITGGWCGREVQSDYKLEKVYADILNLGNIFGVPA